MKSAKTYKHYHNKNCSAQRLKNSMGYFFLERYNTLKKKNTCTAL